VKLYSYSNELLKFVEAKWVPAKFFFGGILLVTIVLVGVISLNQSAGNPLSSRSANILASENNFLRQQASQISPRVRTLEMQAAQLNERANNFSRLLRGGRIVGDTVSKFTNESKQFKRQSLIFATTSYHR
jgi:outer membrane murein-binding lipoprotein Lpp